MKDLIKLGATLPRWERDAACFDLKPSQVDAIFFDDDKADSVPPDAASYCNSCVIQVKCLDWAMTYDEVGVWGNTTFVQRKKLKRGGIARVHCPGCGAIDILVEFDGEVCLSCGLSWRV